MIASLFIPPQDLHTPPMSESPWSLLPAASNHAEALDGLYILITAVCAISMVLVIGAQVYFMWKYKKRSDNDRTSPLTHNGKLEFAWSAIPAIFLVIFFVRGEQGFMELSSPPVDAVQIDVSAKKWSWSFKYPEYPNSESIEDGVPTLIVPLNQPVRLVMNSVDVIHSFYVPVFRVKKDVLPGRYTTLWFTAIKTGTFPVFCTEYCGDEHSSMLARVVVVPPEEYKERVLRANKLAFDPKKHKDEADFGKEVFTAKGCGACHKLDDTKLIGPGLGKIYGKKEDTQQGAILVDDNYIRESLMEPNKVIVKGFAPQMPSYKNQLDEDQIKAIVALIKSIK